MALKMFSLDTISACLRRLFMSSICTATSNVQLESELACTRCLSIQHSSVVNGIGCKYHSDLRFNYMPCMGQMKHSLTVLQNTKDLQQNLPCCLGTIAKPDHDVM